MKCSKVKENENEREMCIRQTKASKDNMKCTYICEPACECENLQVDERKVAEACRASAADDAAFCWLTA